MNKINWNFIAAREGFKLNGYVPDPQRSHSGVTIATGFDIGNATDEMMAGLPLGIQKRFAAYRHLTGIPALHMLQTNPLSITSEQAVAIDAVIKKKLTDELEAKYNHDAEMDFDDLPPEAQTVIASVGFQYGDPWKDTPRFWSQAVKRDWEAMRRNLLNFGDKYSARRKVEAAYLTSLFQTKGALIA